MDVRREIPRAIAWQAQLCCVCLSVISPFRTYGRCDSGVSTITYCGRCATHLDAREAARG